MRKNWAIALPELKHGGRALHHVGHGCDDEPPTRDGLKGVREAGRESKLEVLNQNLLKDLEHGNQVSILFYKPFQIKFGFSGYSVLLLFNKSQKALCV